MTVYSIIAVAGASWMGWRAWRRREREKQIRLDQAYWDKVRRECPSCGQCQLIK